MKSNSGSSGKLRRILETVAFLVLLLLATLLLSPTESIANAVPQPSIPHESFTTNPATSPTISDKVGSKVAVQTRISSSLWDKLNEDPGTKVHYLVTLTEQADTSNNIKDWSEKGWYVYNKLREVANRTQPSVAAILAAQQSLGNVQSYKSYYIINALGAVGNLTSVSILANSPDVARIDMFPRVTFPDEPMGPEPSPTACPIPNCGNYPPGTPVWNVTLVRATEVWPQYTGAGETIGSIDRGAFYRHEAIESKYRGYRGPNDFEHDYNWWDARYGTPTPSSTSTPYDNDGHGTHTIGTLVGGNNIGIAPDAQWIAVSYTAEDGYNSEPDIVEAM